MQLAVSVSPGRSGATSDRSARLLPNISLNLWPRGPLAPDSPGRLSCPRGRFPQLHLTTDQTHLVPGGLRPSRGHCAPGWRPAPAARVPSGLRTVQAGGTPRFGSPSCLFGPCHPNSVHSEKGPVCLSGRLRESLFS